MTTSILVVAIWVMPAISDDLYDIRKICADILKDYCGFHDNVMDLQGTFGDKFNVIDTIDTNDYLSIFDFGESRFMTEEVKKHLKYLRSFNTIKQQIKKLEVDVKFLEGRLERENNYDALNALNQQINAKQNTIINLQRVPQDGTSYGYALNLLKNYAVKYIQYYQQILYAKRNNAQRNEYLESGSATISTAKPIMQFCEQQIKNDDDIKKFWTEFYFNAPHNNQNLVDMSNYAIINYT